MFMKIFLVWYCNHQFFSHRIRSPPPLRWNEGDISRTFIFMPFHYWLCVMFWCAFFCLLCDIFYVPISSRKQMMTKSKLGWMQCQRKKEKSFYWIFTSHSWLFKKKLKFMCWYLLPCWFSLHPLLHRKRYQTFHPFYCGSCHKIIHNTIWYLSPVCTNIIMLTLFLL